MLKILNNDKFTTAQNRHSLVSLKIPILNTLPVRAKVEANRSPILLPLQGVSVYTLIPRALPWAGDWLPFQGAPFRALFVYHVCMLRHLLFGKKNVQRFFWILNTLPLILVELKNKFDILHILEKGGFQHLRLTDNTNSVLVSEHRPRHDRICSQTRPNLHPDATESAPRHACICSRVR